jgi:hypothetical protein
LSHLDLNNPIINKTLEKIVFKENDFKDLKDIINGLKEGRYNFQQLKKKIIESRIRILKDITEFINFYINQQQGTPKSNEMFEIQQDLQEKEKFLELIARRIEKIYQALSIEL